MGAEGRSAQRASDHDEVDLVQRTRVSLGTPTTHWTDGRRVLYTFDFRVMGGGGQLRFVTDAGAAVADAIAKAAVDEAERIEAKYSRYRETSVTSQINRNAGRTPVAVDDETVALVEAALDVARSTGGIFDPTAGVLRRVWDFGAGRVPSPAELAAILPLVDHHQVSVRDGTVFLRRAGMELDFGGFGKEYAVDRLAIGLQRAGVESAIVNLAGDVRAVGGRGDGRPWRIGIADPRERERCRFSVRLIGGAGVASSGDYERSFVKDGVRYHHLLDARTGLPVRGVASATVVAPTTFRAGLLATAALLLGPDEGLERLTAAPAAEGVLITEDGAVLATPGMSVLSDLPGALFAEHPRM